MLPRTSVCPSSVCIQVVERNLNIVPSSCFFKKEVSRCKLIPKRSQQIGTHTHTHQPNPTQTDNSEHSFVRTDETCNKIRKSSQLGHLKHKRIRCRLSARGRSVTFYSGPYKTLVKLVRIFAPPAGLSTSVCWTGKREDYITFARTNDYINQWENSQNFRSLLRASPWEGPWSFDRDFNALSLATMASRRVQKVLHRLSAFIEWL